MPARRLDKTPVDYLAIAVSPGLIMGLVGSLVFFLLAVFYRGEYAIRMHCILACFVFAAVLIGRISITEGSAYAGGYGAVLALVTSLAVIKFVDQPLIGCLLLAVIWWCAHKLTWDCTLIDEQEEDSGQGVLESAGLDYEAADAGGTEFPSVARSGDRATTREHALDTAEVESRGSRWRELIRGVIHDDGRPHAPGVWVVYFSLAALPLFGLGQLLIPISDAARREYALWLLVVYLACGLALLSVTSFLSLRRYLRQRRLEMPAAMTGTWMTAAAVLIVLLLMVAATLPSPGGVSELKLSDYFVLDSPHRTASSVAVFGEDGGSGEGADSRATDEEAAEQSGNSSNDHDNGQPGGGEDSDADNTGAGESDDEKQSDSRGGNEKTEPSSGDGSTSPSGQPHDATADEDSTDENDAKRQPENEQENDPPSKSPSGGSGRQRQSGQGKSAGQSSQSQSGSQPPPGSSFSLPQLAGSFGQWLRLLFYLILAVVVIYLCIRHWQTVRSWVTQLINELRGIFSGLFGRRVAKVEEKPPADAPPERPFAMFSDPFQDGTAGSRSPDELVLYSFAALEAWAAEYGGGRPPELTPLELAARLERDHPHLAKDTQQLATLYARVAYARQRLSPKCLGTVRRFWKRLGESTLTTAAREGV